MSKTTIATQPYPRIEDPNDLFFGYMDDARLTPHSQKILMEDLKKIIERGIGMANRKSSRNILETDDNATAEEKEKTFKKHGRDLFNYFKKYYGDPASTVHSCLNRNYSEVAREEFKKQTLQKQRMNSGWRYQYIAKGTAEKTKRFVSISDLNTSEADFNASIKILNSNSVLNIYISVKNRMNTMGGQDWPKAIFAIEDAARQDKNRDGPYICVFGIAMDKGLRKIKCSARTKHPHSNNTEVWLSDYFWPFFANYSYEEIITAVLDVLLEIGKQDEFEIDLPETLVEEFGNRCKEYDLLGRDGGFNDAHKLIALFCGKSPKKPPTKNIEAR